MNTVNPTQHISNTYEAELQRVKNLIIEMAQTVTQQVQSGLDSLIKLDKTMAQHVIATDSKVNDLEMEIDKACTQIIATRQPAASDLRLIVTSIKVITDLERIGDESLKLSRNALKFIDLEQNSRELKEVRNLGNLVIENLNKVIKSYQQLDVAQAIEVIENDDAINEEFDNICRLLLTKMMEEPREIKNSLRVTWCARALERIGDHVKNISEYLVYLVAGIDVRHINIAELKHKLNNQ
ncbi:phosphate signaling complex protein PhoU [Thalassotalea crassostreae]|uniref:phosphate signaling complex protein PhoU n=1 Tax=Thalassotalea crassostreae TaxID=1763536 RepID=UPI00083842AA|nr:phosphate signaling complex protein PhoU [Thalassotalea crassostreae]